MRAFSIKTITFSPKYHLISRIFWFDRINAIFLFKLYPQVNFIPASRLSNFFIDVSNNTDGSSAEECAYELTPFSASETRVYTCPQKMYGRYVRIRFASDKTEHLQLCEVQIQGAGRYIEFSPSIPHKIFNK